MNHQFKERNSYKMAQFGYPGTADSFFLRFMQSILDAVASIFLICFPAYPEYTVFRCLVCATLVHLSWNVGFCVYDFCAMRRRNYGLNSTIMTLLCIGDWLVGGVTLAAVSASLGVMTFFMSATTHCTFKYLDCLMTIISVFLVFLGWICNAITALSLFWIRASL